MKRFLSMTLSIVMLIGLLVMPSYADGTFLLKEGFEDETAFAQNWTVTDGFASITDTLVHTGTKALQTAKAQGDVTLTDTTSNKRGVLEMWVYQPADGSNSSGLRTKFKLANNDGSLYSTWGYMNSSNAIYQIAKISASSNKESSLAGTLTKGWHQIVIDMTAADNSTYYKDYFYAYVDGVRVDDLKMRQGFGTDEIPVFSIMNDRPVSEIAQSTYIDDVNFYASYSDVPLHRSQTVTSMLFASGKTVENGSQVTPQDGDITLTFANPMAAMDESNVELYERAADSTTHADFAKVEISSVTADETTLSFGLALKAGKEYKLVLKGLTTAEGKALAEDYVIFTTASEFTSTQELAELTLEFDEEQGDLEIEGYTPVDGKVTLPQGQSFTVKASAKSGYVLSKITVFNPSNEVVAAYDSAPVTMSTVENLRIKAEFSEKTVQQVTFREGFEEADLSTNWDVSANNSFAAISRDIYHTGSQSLKTTSKNGSVVLQQGVSNGVYEIWYYDENPDCYTNTSLIHLSDGTGTNQKYEFGMKKAAYNGSLVAITGLGEVRNVAPLEAGWHQLLIDTISNPTLVDIYVDGEKKLASHNSRMTALSNISQLKLYSAWDSYGDPIYWDDLALYPSLAEAPVYPWKKISSVTFADGESAVGAEGVIPANQPITLSFTEDMKELTADNLLVFVRSNQSETEADFQAVNEVTVEKKSGDTYTLTIPDMALSSEYKVLLHGIQTEAGQTLGDDYFLFSTAEERISNVVIKGVPQVGNTLTGTYQYQSASGMTDDSTYQWYRSETQEGEGTAIADATEKQYTLTEEDENCWISFEVVCGPIRLMSPKVQVTAKGQEPTGLQPNTYYVALDGSDNNPGTKEAPFATLEQARDTIRALGDGVPEGGITVYLRGGTYHLKQSFVLEEQDSGTAEKPIRYQAYGEEKVTLSGGLELDSSAFEAVSGEMQQKLWDDTAKSKVIVTDLKSQGIDTWEKIQLLSNRSVIGVPMILYNGQTMRLVRWPNSDTNTDWPKETKIYRGHTLRDGGTGISKMQLVDDFTLLEFKHRPEDLILYGYFAFFWYGEYLYPEIDYENKQISAPESMMYGPQGANPMPYRILNCYEALDEPGEWYVDREAMKLYLYPPTEEEQPEIVITNADFNLVEMNHTSYVTISGIDFSGGKKNAVVMQDSSYCTVDCAEISGFEELAVSIADGFDNTVKNSHIHHTGIGGISVSGGDRETITPSNHLVTNCEIHDFSLLKLSYAPGVNLGGVGNKVSHCEFYNSPHAAILFGGVENMMEYNVLHDVVLDATDMGAIYTGRDYSDHGNVIRYSYFYDIGNPTDHRYTPCCIFTDDGSCDLVVYGNVFYPNNNDCQALKVHGGLENYFYNNLFIDANQLMYNCNWSLAELKAAMFALWQSRPAASYKDKLDSVKYNPLYLEKWPWLKTTQNQDTVVYLGTVLRNNMILYVEKEFGGDHTVWKRLPNDANSKTIRGWDDKQTNLILQNQSKSLFEDFDNGNFRIDQQLYDQMPDFEEIPFDEMGMYETDNAVPVVSKTEVLGTISLGGSLLGDYYYNDADGDLEGNSEYLWSCSDTKYGQYTQIGTEKSLILTEEISGKYVKFSVKPVDSRGGEGEWYSADPVMVVYEKESLETMIASITKEVNAAKEGTTFGEYKAGSIAEIKAALKQASEETDLSKAALELEGAYESWKSQQVTEAVVKDGVITIPDDMKEVTLQAGEISELTLIKVGSYPKTTIYGTVNGVALKVVLPDGFTAKSKEFKVITALKYPTGDFTADPLMMAAIFGEGNGNMIVTVSDVSQYSLYRKTETGYQRLSDSAAQWETTGGEYLIATPAAPSNDATLESVIVDGKTISLSGKTKLILTSDKSEVTIQVIPSNGQAICNPQEQTLSVPGVATIEVVAGDKKTKLTYQIKVNSQLTESVTPSPTATVIEQSAGSHAGTGFVSIGGPGKTEQTVRFTDVIGHWAEQDIYEMAELGIVAGVTDTTFEPDRSVTRAEFAALITRALKITAANSEAGFTDVSSADWYAEAVAAAASAGLMSGYEGCFRPEDKITREEVAVVIMKAYVFLGKAPVSGSLDRFADRDQISEWAEPYVDQAVSAGIVSGVTENTFAPWENATRAQAASLIKRLLNS